MNEEVIGIVNEQLNNTVDSSNIKRNGMIYGYLDFSLDGGWNKGLVSSYKEKLCQLIKNGIVKGITKIKPSLNTTTVKMNGYPIALLMDGNGKTMNESLNHEFFVNEMYEEAYYAFTLYPTPRSWDYGLLDGLNDNKITHIKNVFSFIYYFKNNNIMDGEVEIIHFMTELKRQMRES